MSLHAPQEEAEPVFDEAEFQEQVRRNLPRNYAAHLAHGVFGQTGFRLLNTPTFIPSYVFSLYPSNVVVGIVGACQSLGQSLSPLFSATLIEHRRRVLPLGVTIGSLMRMQVLGIALAGFFLPTRLNLVAVCVFLGLLGFFSGMQGVIFNFLMSKVIPIAQRGRLTGLRNMLAGIVSALVGYFGGSYFIERNTFGNGYATTFLLAFVLTEIGLLMLLMLREPDSPVVRERRGMASRLADLPHMLRGDRNFTAFIGACVLAGLGRLAMPYYVLYAQQITTITGNELGLLTAAFLLASMATNVIWGWLADRNGFRMVLVGSLSLWIAGTFALQQSHGIGSLIAVFATLGAGSGGMLMGQTNLVLEFGNREDLPLRIGATSSATEAMGVLAPPIGGFLAAQFSYPTVFACAVAFKVAALIASLCLREPRFHRGPAR